MPNKTLITIGKKQFVCLLNLRILLASILIVSAGLWVHGQQINFEPFEEPWDIIIEKAEALNKPVFVDVYTDWCAPCKWMDMHVFNQPEVAAYINPNFISVKANAEKGHGVEFSNRYHVNSYPTYLFFAPDGSLILTGLGSMQPEVFLKTAKNALENQTDGISLEKMKVKIGKGNTNPEFILQYIRQLSAQRQPNALLVEEYLRALPEDDLYTPEVLSLVKMGYFGRMPANGRAFAVLLKEYEQYPVKSWELMSPWNTIRNRLLEHVDSAGTSQDTTWLAEILEANANLDNNPDIAQRERLYMLCRYHAYANDRTNFITSMEQFANQFIVHEDIQDLNAIDQTAFQQAVTIKFGADYRPNINHKAYTDFQRTYYSEARIIGDEILHIAALYKERFPSDFFADSIPDIHAWLMKSLDFYQSNPIYMNEEYLQLRKRSYERLFEQ